MARKPMVGAFGVLALLSLLGACVQSATCPSDGPSRQGKHKYAGPPGLAAL